MWLDDYDGIKSRNIFCLWTGDELMSENRLRALWTILSNTGCSVSFITKQTVGSWVKPSAPLHPAFRFLSSTHKADYLRCYLMHQYGGGYADIKLTHKSWVTLFGDLEKDKGKLALGYAELPHGIPHIEGTRGDLLRSCHSELIGLCAFIFKKRTAITQRWFDETNSLLDKKLELLEKNPARHPMDQTGVILPNGDVSIYPLRWAELLGEIFHPIIFDYKSCLIKSAIEPVFGGYR